MHFVLVHRQWLFDVCMCIFYNGQLQGTHQSRHFGSVLWMSGFLFVCSLKVYTVGLLWKCQRERWQSDVICRDVHEIAIGYAVSTLRTSANGWVECCMWVLRLLSTDFSHSHAYSSAQKTSVSMRIRPQWNSKCILRPYKPEPGIKWQLEAPIMPFPPLPISQKEVVNPAVQCTPSWHAEPWSIPT